MKKILFGSLFALSAQLFAQEEIMPTAFPTEMNWVSSSFGLEIIGILIGVFFYVALPVFLYCISSYSLSLLNKHYNKKVSSKISWIPFVRYYDFVKQATLSPKKAFLITVLPWILSVIGFAGVIMLGMQGIAVSWITPELITCISIMGVGILGIIAMNFWRAFIIAKHVKWDVTTALGLSTYTAIVLWYIALDRVKKNTNIIGIIGFVGIGLVICFYAWLLFLLGFSGLSAFLGV
jgi:hypothetical protein